MLRGVEVVQVDVGQLPTTGTGRMLLLCGRSAPGEPVEVNHQVAFGIDELLLVRVIE